MRELSLQEIQSINGGLAAEDVIFTTGMTVSSALGAEATIGTGMFATAGSVGVAAGAAAFGGGYLVGMGINHFFGQAISDGVWFVFG